MGSVRRLARMLASPALAHSYPPPPWQEASLGADDVDVFAEALLPSADLVLQSRGPDRGRLTRLDSLGLVVRVKRPADESTLF